MSSSRNFWRQWNVLLLPLIVLPLLAAVVFGADQLCVNDANRRMPYYPDVERVEERHNGFRVRGIGSSMEVVASEDSLEEVTSWYEAHQIELLKARRTRGVNNANYVLEEADGGQTRIVYITQCVM